jgi:hypothetical protein
MNVRSLLCALALTAIPTLGLAQAHLPDLKDKLKIHQERLPHPSHRLLVIHPRRLAVPQKGGRRQIRIMSNKRRHDFRKGVRKVTHHLTAPHRHD